MFSVAGTGMEISGGLRIEGNRMRIHTMAEDIDTPGKQDQYLKRRTVLRKMLIQAMQAMQTSDLKHVEEPRRLLDVFDRADFRTHSR